MDTTLKIRTIFTTILFVWNAIYMYDKFAHMDFTHPLRESIFNIVIIVAVIDLIRRYQDEAFFEERLRKRARVRPFITNSSFSTSKSEKINLTFKDGSSNGKSFNFEKTILLKNIGRGFAKNFNISGVFTVNSQDEEKKLKITEYNRDNLPTLDIDKSVEVSINGSFSKEDVESLLLKINYVDVFGENYIDIIEINIKSKKSNRVQIS